MSAMTVVLFLGGYLSPFGFWFFDDVWMQPIWFVLKTSLIAFVFLWTGTFPRYRYDQLMRLGWKVFLPLSLFWVVLTAGVIVGFGLMKRRWFAVLFRSIRSLLLLGLSGAYFAVDHVHRPPGHGELSARRACEPALPREHALRRYPTVKSAASPASCAKPSAPRRPSPSRPSRATAPAYHP